jgi:hypothetical protein
VPSLEVHSASRKDALGLRHFESPAMLPLRYILSPSNGVEVSEAMRIRLIEMSEQSAAHVYLAQLLVEDFSIRRTHRASQGIEQRFLEWQQDMNAEEAPDRISE